MRVIATNRGYDNVTTREPGDEFEMPEGSKGTWFRSLEEPEPAAKPVKVKSDKPPKTLGEAAAKSTDEPLA